MNKELLTQHKVKAIEDVLNYITVNHNKEHTLESLCEEFQYYTPAIINEAVRIHNEIYLPKIESIVTPELILDGIMNQLDRAKTIQEDISASIDRMVPSTVIETDITQDQKRNFEPDYTKDVIGSEGDYDNTSDNISFK